MTEALSENVLLHDLDLNCNQLCRTNFEGNLQILLNLTSFVANNKRLRHLNLQGMHLSLALEKPPKVEEKVKEKPKAKKEDKKASKKSPKKVKEPKKSISVGETKPGISEEEKEMMQEFAFQNLIKMMTKSDSLQCVHLSNNGFSEQDCIALLEYFNVDTDKNEISPDKVINLNKLRQLYLTYEVNHNKNLSDHAKIINNELLK